MRVSKVPPVYRPAQATSHNATQAPVDEVRHYAARTHRPKADSISFSSELKAALERQSHTSEPKH